jgi:hypothetical protein
MPKRSSKHATLDRRMVVPSQGMDLSLPANAIGDNMLSRAWNWWYEPERGLCVRQGLTRADITHGSTAIVALHPYAEADGTMHILCATNGKVKELSSGAWVDVASITTTDHVSMLTFNGAALIADSTSTSGILKYDGATTSYITDSPSAPMCITSIANRVVCASASTPDYVYFSGPNDYTDWDTSTGGALAIAAGFGDGYSITGFATIYDLLVVSKVKRDSDGSIVGRKLYAISTAGDAANWFVKQISAENAASLKGGIVGVGEVAYLLDTNGFKAISPAPNGQYGDITTDVLIGNRVNKMLAGYARVASDVVMQYIAPLAQVWCVVNTGAGESKTFIWHPVQGAFTQVDWGAFVPRAICTVGETVYVAGDDGVLYFLDNATGDELADGVLTDIYASLQTRVFEGLGGDLILKKLKPVLQPLLVSEVSFDAWIAETGRRTNIATLDMGEGLAGVPVYEATDDVVDATYYLADADIMVQPIYYGGPRAAGMAIQVRVLGGRVILNSITAEFAVVGR